MSDVLDKTQITLQYLQELFSDNYINAYIEEDTLFLINEYGIAVMISVDADDGFIRWFCADKIREDADELELAQLCKKFNDSGDLKCCYVGYDINDIYKTYLGCSYELSYDYGVIRGQLMASHRAFNESMLSCFFEFQELGYFPERTEV